MPSSVELEVPRFHDTLAGRESTEMDAGCLRHTLLGLLSKANLFMGFWLQKWKIF